MLKKSIKEIHPLMAHMVLARFGFHTHRVYDASFGLFLKKVESIAHWRESRSMSLKFSGNSTALLQSSQTVLHYLQLLVDFVNANPAIM